MGFAFRKLLPLLVIGCLSALLAISAKRFASLTDFDVLLTGGVVFCLFITLWNYILLSWQSTLIRKKKDAIHALEDSVLRRILEIEKGQTNIEELKILAARIDEIETNNAAPSFDAVEANAIDDPALYNNDKVVVLKANRPIDDRLKKPKSRRRRGITEAIEGCFSENLIDMKLQPVIDLQTREIVAVEAFGYFRIDGKDEPVEALIKYLSDTQRCRFDWIMLSIIAKAAQKMEADGQLLAIHFSFLSWHIRDHHTWDKIANALNADTRLAKVLVPQMSMSEFSRLDQEMLARFTELKEHGLRPCLTNCSSPTKILRIAKQQHISSFKIPASELLKYTSKKGEKIAETLIPDLAELAITPIITDIEHAHQATSLIDFDVRFGQGPFISPPRNIVLASGEASEVANATSE